MTYFWLKQDADELLKFLDENFIPHSPIRHMLKEEVPGGAKKFLQDKDTLLGEYFNQMAGFTKIWQRPSKSENITF